MILPQQSTLFWIASIKLYLMHTDAHLVSTQLVKATHRLNVSQLEWSEGEQFQGEENLVEPNGNTNHDQDPREIRAPRNQYLIRRHPIHGSINARARLLHHRGVLTDDEYRRISTLAHRWPVSSEQSSSVEPGQGKEQKKKKKGQRRAQCCRRVHNSFR